MDYNNYSEKVWNFIDEQLVKKSLESLTYEDKLDTILLDSIERVRIAGIDNNTADVEFHTDVLKCVRELIKDSKKFI